MSFDVEMEAVVGVWGASTGRGIDTKKDSYMRLLGYLNSLRSMLCVIY